MRDLPCGVRCLVSPGVTIRLLDHCFWIDAARRASFGWMRKAFLSVTASLVLIPAAQAESGYMRGDWTVRQKTLRVENLQGTRPGAVVYRTWVFGTGCGSRRRCTIRMQRSDGSFTRIKVRLRDGVYSGSRRTFIECSQGGQRGNARLAVNVHLGRTVRRGARLYVSAFKGTFRFSSGPNCGDAKPSKGVYGVRGTPDDLPEPPAAGFTFEPSQPTISASSNTVLFRDDSDDDADGGQINRWSWDFGDPNSGAANASIEKEPAHVFGSPGSYVVTLTVRDDDGLSGTFRDIVQVGP
jgi:hypothetical protein